MRQVPNHHHLHRRLRLHQPVASHNEMPRPAKTQLQSYRLPFFPAGLHLQDNSLCRILYGPADLLSYHFDETPADTSILLCQVPSYHQPEKQPFYSKRIPSQLHSLLQNCRGIHMDHPLYLFRYRVLYFHPEPDKTSDFHPSDHLFQYPVLCQQSRFRL